MIYGIFKLDKEGNNPNGTINELDEKLNWETLNYSSNYELSYSSENSLFFCKSLGVIILFDGFVYNSNELVNKLNKVNSNSKTQEIIAEAFLEWGPGFAEKLNGNFAICVYLEKENALYLFRDHVGLRPLAFSQVENIVYISTDPMGLSKSLYLKEKIDPDFLLNSFFWTGHQYDLLPNKKAITVKPGHYVKITLQGWDEKKYWFPENIQKDNSLTLKIVTKDLNTLLSHAVRIRSDQRHTAAAHVSGGLDSGIVAALARKEFQDQEKFNGFSWTRGHPTETVRVNYDERNLVNEFCQKYNSIPVFP